MSESTPLDKGGKLPDLGALMPSKESAEDSTSVGSTVADAKAGADAGRKVGKIVDTVAGGSTAGMGQAVGAAAGAAMGVLKDKKRRRIAIAASALSALAPFLLPLAVVMALMMSFAPASSNSQANHDMSGKAATADGLSEEELSASVNSSSSTGVQWQIVAAVNQQVPDEEPFFGITDLAAFNKQQVEFGLTPLTAEGLKDESTAAGAYGQLLAAMIHAEDLNVDTSLIEAGATSVPTQNWRVIGTDPDSVALHEASKKAFLAALSKIETSQKGNGQLIYDTALRWALGDQSCAAGGVTGDFNSQVSGSWTQPTQDADGQVGSGFGMRMHPILGISRMHWGVDLGAPLGTPLWAASDGVVELIDSNSSAGTYVKLRHANGVETQYLHIEGTSNVLVKVGDTVKVGQQIARMGSGGLSTASHLHFEVILNGTKIDPAKFYSAMGMNVAGAPGSKLTSAPATTSDGTASAFNGTATALSATTTPSPAPTTGATTATTGATSPTQVVRIKWWDGGTVALTETQLRNAKTIATTVGKIPGTNDKVVLAALAVAIVEDGLSNNASQAVPESLNYPHDAVDKGDHDSVGLFQQRPSWGSVQSRMDPVTTTKAFVGGPNKPADSKAPGLMDISGWETMEVGKLAQKVQVSGFPDRYTQAEEGAKQLQAALGGVYYAGTACSADGSNGSMPGGSVTIVDGQFTSSDRNVGSTAHLTPQTLKVMQVMAGTFPEVKSIGGYRTSAIDKQGHPAGKGLDVMIPNWNTPEGKALGDKGASFIIANYKALDVKYIIWRQHQWTPTRGWVAMADRGDSTANHMDHIHMTMNN